MHYKGISEYLHGIVKKRFPKYISVADDTFFRHRNVDGNSFVVITDVEGNCLCMRMVTSNSLSKETVRNIPLICIKPKNKDCV